MKQWAWLALGWLASSHAADTAGDFDYYVLAMSWSPQYCATRPDDSEQCNRRYGFVLHGLWPQYQRGYPADCSQEPLQPAIRQRFDGLYPSEKLYRHEWQKHGTCSGLGQAGYHQLSASLKQRFRVPASLQAPVEPLRTSPAALRDQLLAANSWLTPQSVALTCSDGGRFLQEVRVCVAKDGSRSQPCGEDVQAAERRSCRQPSLLVRSVR